MNQQVGKPSRPLPPPPPSTIGRTNHTLSEAEAKSQLTSSKNRQNPADNSRPKRGSGQPTLAYIIKQAYDLGYSDVHVGVGEVPRMRDRAGHGVNGISENRSQHFYELAT